jgi:hypothetical protein
MPERELSYVDDDEVAVGMKTRAEASSAFRVFV